MNVKNVTIINAKSQDLRVGQGPVDVRRALLADMYGKGTASAFYIRASVEFAAYPVPIDVVIRRDSPAASMETTACRRCFAGMVSVVCTVSK